MSTSIAVSCSRAARANLGPRSPKGMAPGAMAFATGLLFASFGLAGCGASDGTEEPVVQERTPLVVDTCTGAQISAAIAAGGSVLLDCGASPITIAMPATSVTRPTQVSAAFPGTVTFATVGTFLSVSSGASLSVSGVTFDGQNLGGMAIHADDLTANRVSVSGVTFRRYDGFAIDVGGPTTLTVSNSTFDSNTNTSFGGALYIEGATVTVSNTTFSNNRGNNGGAVSMVAGTLNVSASAFVENQASVGGGVFVTGAFSSATVANSSFTMDVASFAGAAIASEGAVTIAHDCTFVDDFSPRGALYGNVQVK
jgi:hypothetical protein